MSVVFFFKQKTAYEMRISDWSSDVCSSDLAQRPQYGSARGVNAAGEYDAKTVLRAVMTDGTDARNHPAPASWRQSMLPSARRTEPPRDCRRPFGLSYAAMATSSSMARTAAAKIGSASSGERGCPYL